MNRPAAWLVTYDIRDPRRLGRLHRFLSRRATPVQYSVFALRATPGAVGQLAGEIEELIDPKVDDVRIYRVPEPAEITTLGHAILPEGAILTGPTAPLHGGGPVDTPVSRRKEGDR
jgi:CRISPR-associated protein Cas2